MQTIKGTKAFYALADSSKPIFSRFYKLLTFYEKVGQLKKVRAFGKILGWISAKKKNYYRK